MKILRSERISPSLFAAASALSLAVGGGVAAQTSAPSVSVAVFAEHYVLAGRQIDDLDALERAVNAINPRAVRLEACGDGTARAQMAAAHRFRSRYLELRLLEPGAPGCQAAVIPQAVPVSQRLGPRPFGIDDAAVERWWYDQMP